MKPNGREVELMISGKMPNPSGFPEFLIKKRSVFLYGLHHDRGFFL
jgi:hypothetical protein